MQKKTGFFSYPTTRILHREILPRTKVCIWNGFVYVRIIGLVVPLHLQVYPVRNYPDKGVKWLNTLFVRFLSVRVFRLRGYPVLCTARKLGRPSHLKYLLPCPFRDSHFRERVCAAYFAVLYFSIRSCFSLYI